MADHRTYIKVHDGLPQHPKIEGLSDRAFRLLIETWCYCSQYLTDGLLTEAAWKRRGTTKARAELLAVGLVTLSEDGSVDVHDYSEHQRTREEVAEFLAKKRDAGALGNHKRWHISAGQKVAGCSFCDESGSHLRSRGDRKPSSQTIARDRDRDRDRDREELQETPPTSSGPPVTKKGTRVPDPFPLDAALVEWAKAKAPNSSPDDHEAFMDFWRGVPGQKGVKLDWPGTWRNWMRKASTEHAPRGGRATPTPIERAAGVAEMAARVAARHQPHLRAIGDQ